MLTPIAILLSLASSPFSPPSQECQAQEIEPWVAVERDLLRDHYARVERELIAARPQLDEATLAARQRTIEGLRAYREAGDFGRATGPDQAGHRAFLFVDDEGRRCAVAELLHLWGEDELVEAVHETSNDALVQELTSNPELRGWLERVGLTVDEAIRIQGPGITIEVVDPGRPGPFTPGRGGRRPGRNETSRATAAPATPRPALASPPAEQGVARASAAGTPTPVVNTGIPEGLDLRTHWWAWWEYNKLGWLVQDRSLFSKNVEGDHTRAASRGELLRLRALPMIEQAVKDPDARVRAAAVVAYGRVKGEGATDTVVALLKDPQLLVRTAAILALGAAGSSRATYELMKIAHTDHAEGKASIGYSAPFHARIALGLALQGSGVDPADIPLTAEADDELMRQSLAFVPRLVASARYMPRVREASGLFDDRGEVVRDARGAFPRAVEALRYDHDEPVLEALLHALGARDLDVRRSAATALGSYPSEHVLPVLLTAFEVEKEELTRGLLLIAIAQQGGEQAREFLIENLAYGKRSTRPWNALALGILAGEENDEVAREALRSAFAKERNRQTADAFLLAFGVARDARAAEILEYELRRAGTDMTRANAALGLALCGAPAAAPILRRALESECSGLTRSTIAQALGVVGDPQDATRLVAFLDEVTDPILVVQHAAAIAFHGNVMAADALIGLMDKDGLNSSTRAGVIQALGMLLDETPPFRLAALSRDANFSVFPVELDPALQSTL